MSDDPNLPDTGKGTPDPIGPAPWERRKPPRPEEGLKHKLSDVPESDTPPAREGEADHLADDQMSLGSKLRGGGRDVGEDASKEEVRLCPGCGKVTSYMQGVCSNCGYKINVAGTATPRFSAAPVVEGGSPLPRNLIIALIIILIALGIIFLPRLFAGRSTSTPATTTPEATTGPGETHPGQLLAVTIDEAFREDAKAALLAGNEAWEAAGVDCFAYRYDVYESTVPATSQAVYLTAYTGGADAQASINSPEDAPFREAVAPFLDRLNQRPGVEASLSLRATEGEEPPSPEDVYIRYGYYFGREHWDTIEPIVKGLESYKQEEGQYPDVLSTAFLPSTGRTKGGYFFLSDGYGYLPIYRTDGNGNIVMGTGSGLASLKPAECTGYYLVLYTASQGEGLDVHSDADTLYYRERIAPFPYAPSKPVRNMPFNPDGEPDGIACVVKTGELQR